MEILKVENLSKKYGKGLTEVDALKSVVLSVNKGEFLAIMGASGSGKSTLLHLLGGLDKPSDGQIFLSETKLSELSEKKRTLLRRKNIGFVFQFFNLLPTLTAEENISLPFLISGKSKKEYKKKVDDMIDLVGISHRKNHKPDELSGGEQQRAAIARALVTEPSLILADEPTGNLDSKNGAEILNLLRESCDKLNQTIAMVTHDPKAATYADRVVFLKDGRIVSELTVNAKRDQEPILKKLKELEI